MWSQWENNVLLVAINTFPLRLIKQNIQMEVAEPRLHIPPRIPKAPLFLCKLADFPKPCQGLPGPNSEQTGSRVCAPGEMNSKTQEKLNARFLSLPQWYPAPWLTTQLSLPSRSGQSSDTICPNSHPKKELWRKHSYSSAVQHLSVCRRAWETMWTDSAPSFLHVILVFACAFWSSGSAHYLLTYSALSIGRVFSSLPCS